MAAPKVLIIDDEPALQLALKTALKNEGYQLLFADNGENGLEIFHRANPELIFLDLKMPVMDGYGFLKAIDITPDVPFSIIVITGHGLDHEIKRCYKLGIDFFLKKPVSMVEVCGLAKRCIEVKRLRREREGLIENLRQANETIRQLKRFLVLCAACKQVKDQNGLWHDLDVYIREHTDTKFSHSICPRCARKLYPEFIDQAGGRGQDDGGG